MGFTARNVLKSFVAPALLAATTVTIGCGGAGSQEFLKSFTYGFQDSVAQVTAEFSTEVSLNVEMQYPLKQYGTLRFIPAEADKGFRIQAQVDLSVFADSEWLKIRPSRNLPNGQPFPSYITSELSQIKVGSTDKFNSSLYLGFKQDSRVVGAGLELKFLDSKFPEGLTISQKILDKDKRPLGVVTLYGPKLKNGAVEIPGGLFIATNVSDLQRYRGQSFAFSDMESEGILTPYDRFDVAGPHSAEYSDEVKLYGLFKMFKKEGRAAGMMD